MTGLAALAVLVYINSLHGQFVFDDLWLVTENPRLTNMRTFDAVLSLASGWRQLLFLTYALNFYWSGLDTFSYHAVNVFLHALNVLLVYAIVLVAFRDGSNARFTRFAVAAIFAVHTMLSGAVSYIAGRSSVLCATFYFAAVLLFFKACDASRTRVRLLYFVSAGVAGFLAFQVKQEAITLPLFVAAAAWLRGGRANWRWLAPLAAVPLAVIVIRREQFVALFASVSRNADLAAGGFEAALPPAAYFRTYLTSVVGYFFPRFAVPANLSADPHIVPVANWYSPEFVFSLLTLVGLAWLAVRLRQREPLFSLGVAALLVSPLLAYAAIPLADVALEHRAYIPGLGAALIFGWALQKIPIRRPGVRRLALGCLVALFGTLTVVRNPVFADNVSFWEDAAAKAPGKPRPHFNLGQAYQQAGRFGDAVRKYERALALDPDIHAAYSNIAGIYVDGGRFEEAEEMLSRVTMRAPDFTEGFINLAVLHLRRGDPDRALEALDRAIELDGESASAHFNKGEALTQKDDFASALASYREAARLRPDIDSFRLALGAAHGRAGDRLSSERELLALTNGSSAAEAYRRLGSLYGDAGEPERAISFFTRAAELRPAYPEAHHDLGVLYLRTAMPDEAIRHLAIVIDQRPGFGPAYLNLAAAYQMKGDLRAADRTLSEYVSAYGNTDSPYVTQARERLGLFR